MSAAQKVHFPGLLTLAQSFTPRHLVIVINENTCYIKVHRLLFIVTYSHWPSGMLKIHTSIHGVLSSVPCNLQGVQKLGLGVATAYSRSFFIL